MTDARAIICLGLALAAAGVQAQSDTKRAKTPATERAEAPAQTTPQLAAKLVQLLNLDDASVALIQRPLAQMLQNAATAMETSGVPAEQREGLLVELRADVKAVADKLVPLVKASAEKGAPDAVGKPLAEKFSATELRQLIAYLESPLNKKFLAMLPELQAALNARVLADTRDAVTPQLTELQKTLTARITAARDAAAAQARTKKAKP